MQIPAGSIGEANESGWMDNQTFSNFIKHFTTYAKPSIGEKIILLLDNHKSHLSLYTIDFCRENGSSLVFSPHTSHKLQPLDGGVIGSFKTYVNSFIHAWITNHPGQTMRIYDLPGIVAQALPKSMTPINITSGFKVAGIRQFTRDISQKQLLPLKRE
jgi:hypothetical protein